jgi:hypothetical protein
MAPHFFHAINGEKKAKSYVRKENKTRMILTMDDIDKGDTAATNKCCDTVANVV